MKLAIIFLKGNQIRIRMNHVKINERGYYLKFTKEN